MTCIKVLNARHSKPSDKKILRKVKILRGPFLTYIVFFFPIMAVLKKQIIPFSMHSNWFSHNFHHTNVQCNTVLLSPLTCFLSDIPVPACNCSTIQRPQTEIPLWQQALAECPRQFLLFIGGAWSWHGVSITARILIIGLKLFFYFSTIYSLQHNPIWTKYHNNLLFEVKIR